MAFNGMPKSPPPLTRPLIHRRSRWGWSARSSGGQRRGGQRRPRLLCNPWLSLAGSQPALPACFPLTALQAAHRDETR